MCALLKQAYLSKYYILMLDTPILFLIFNRPNTTARVFKRIRQVKPRQLFVAADGPRGSVIGDIEYCIKTRAIIDKIDWKCDVKTLFREENLGCARAVSSGITWFFEHVEEGIILEDDCLPDKTFFFFCQLMLEKYRNNDNVMQITGTNTLLDKYKKQNNTYFFSTYNSIWGWATWRSAWSKFSLDLHGWRTIEPLLSERILNPSFCHLFLDLFLKAEEGQVNSWAIPWSYHFHLSKGLCVTPNGNLIQNIGYVGVHYQDGFKNPLLETPIIPFKIKNIEHPSHIEIDFEKDNLMFDFILKPKWSLYDRIYNKILRNYLKLFPKKA